MSDTRRAPEASSADAGPVGSVSRPSFKRTLTFFGFFAITASMVMTVYEYPSFASSGFQLVFFLIIGGILWFLPVALCAAEMATVKGWESGGIFAWVGNTLGRRWGFAALFFQWFQITVGFVTMAFFILAALAYVFRWDALYNNPLVMFFGVAAIVWLLTLTQLGGTKYTARISKVGFVGGIIVPVLVLLVGLVIYFATGGVSQIKMDAATFVPDFGKVDTLHIGPSMSWIVFVVALLLALGVLAEISAWIVGPSRALLDTAHDGILPPSFKKVNKHGVSVKTVVIQAVIVTVWDAVLCGSIALSGGSSSSVGYLTAIGLTVVIYLVGYVLFFLGYFYLIFKKKNLQRSFQLPGGTPFKAIVAGVGLIMTVATLIISFFPSSNLDAQSNAVYQATLGVAFAISVAIPFIIYALRHRWEPKPVVPVGATVAAPSGAAMPARPAAPEQGAHVRTDASTSGPINKRTKARDAMGGPRDASGTPRSAGASGAVAGGGLSERVAQGISSVVVGVTSRPPGPIPVDAKDPHGAPDPLRTPTVDEGRAHEMSQPPACGVPTPQNPMPVPCDVSDEDSASRHAASSSGAERSAADAADVRDDLIDRTAEGDPSLRASVTEGVVGQGVPQADPDTPDPQRETSIDTDKPAR